MVDQAAGSVANRQVPGSAGRVRMMSTTLGVDCCTEVRSLLGERGAGEQGSGWYGVKCRRRGSNIGEAAVVR